MPLYQRAISIENVDIRVTIMKTRRSWDRFSLTWDFHTYKEGIYIQMVPIFKCSSKQEIFNLYIREMDGSEIYSTVVSNLRDENFSIFPTPSLGTAGTDGDWRSPFERNPNVKVFVVFTAIFMILGSWGNTLVIGAFFVNKVCSFIRILC